MARNRIAKQEVPGTRFLDPEVLGRIGNLELVARTVVDGFIQGLHGSPFVGLSADFVAHRPYIAGDDIRQIDWKVLGRTDRYFVKESEAETNTNVVFVLDASRSMEYGSGAVTKFDYGRYLTACLAWLSVRQLDRVGAAVLGAGVQEYVPPSVRHRRQILAALDRATPEPAESIIAPLSFVAETLKRRGIVVLVSDLYASPDELRRTVGGLGGHGQDVIVFHVLDSAELEFPFRSVRSFVDLESEERLTVVPDEARRKYMARVKEHIESVTRELSASRVDYELVDTSEPLDRALFRYLSMRARRGKVGRRQ